MNDYMLKIGSKLPSSLKKSFKYVYSILPTNIRYGSQFKNFYEFLEKSQWWSKEELESYQLEQLNKLLNHAYTNVPYYKKVFNENGLVPQDIQDFKDLNELPYLTKDIFKENFKDFIAKNVNLNNLSSISTSGTSGKALQFYGSSQIDQQELAAVIHQWSRVGFKVETKRVELRGKITGLTVDYDPIYKILRLKPLIINSDVATHYLKIMNKFNASYIHGYPSAISHLAYMIKKNHLKVPFKLKAVLFASEVVYNWQKSIVEEIFNCRTFNHYGQAERVVTATECENSYKYHCLPQYGITEIDNKNNEIIGTGFFNYITPFIRYRTTDVASGISNSCNECDREYFPIINKIEGRLEDYIITNKGIFPPAVITHPFKNLKKIKNTQIIQKSEDELLLLVESLEKDEYYDKELKILVNNLKDILGFKVNIRVEEMDSIPLNQSGKFKWIISDISKNIIKEGF